MKIWLPTIRAGSGADVFTDRLAAALRRSGCDCEVTWFHHALELFPAGMRRALPRDVDVIHANSWSAFALAGMGIPLVSTDHGYVRDSEFVRIKPVTQRIYHELLIAKYVDRSMKDADALTAVSDGLAAAIKEASGRHVHAIPNWVDVNLFKPTPRPNGRALRVLYAGGTSMRKGFDVVRRIAAQRPAGIELHCPSSLKKAFKGETTHITFYDRVPHTRMPALYASCDLVLMPSRYEGFGYVACEALASGRPVIGFACAALSEVCDEAGALSETEDVGAMMAAIEDLNATRSKIDDMARSGRRRVCDRFVEERSIAAYIDLYRGLCGRS